MNGKLIVIEGLDGSGKATQTALLRQFFTQQGITNRSVTFPDYQSPACEPVKMYLNGQFGARAEDVNAYAASVLYTVDRFASYKTDWQADYRNGSVIVADRYTTSNAIHQCAKLPREQWDEYLTWLFDLEYGKVAVPKPDCVIYLRVEPEVSQRLMDKRYADGSGHKDIHEKDVAYLQKAQQAAAYCAEKLCWNTVQCVADGAMRTVEDISREVVRIAMQAVK